MPLAALTLVACLVCAPAPPEIFTREPYDAALARAVAEKRLALVDITADYCPPCRRMEAETWPDAEVRRWVEAHAIAVRVPHTDRARIAPLDVEGFPTVIAMREGREVARLLGFRSAPQLLAWLEWVKAGAKPNVAARLDAALKMSAAGRLEEATGEFAWLWKNMLAHEPALRGVRSTTLAREMFRLTGKHQAARAVFEALRAEAEAGEQREDWFLLNEILGESPANLAWFDRAKDDPAQAAALQRCVVRFERLFAREGRWADVAWFHPRPLETLAQLDRRRHPELFVQRVAFLYAGLLAARRDSDATSLAAAVAKLEGVPQLRSTMVTAALEAGQPRPEHRDWTDDEALKRRVSAMLEKGGR